MSLSLDLHKTNAGGGVALVRLEKSPEMSVSKWKSPEKLRNAAKTKATIGKQRQTTAANANDRAASAAGREADSEKERVKECTNAKSDNSSGGGEC